MNKLEQVHNILNHKRLDAVIVLSDYNRRYLSGFTGTSGALIITPKKIISLLISDILNKPQIKQKALKLLTVKMA